MAADRPFPDQEPSAAIREFARNMWEMYVAMVQEGFSEAQSFSVVTSVVQTALRPNSN